MTEIGSAYVKVRPDTRGFQSETSSALKQPLVSIGKLITGALAIKGGIDFGKELIADAARVQKSAEVIRSEFGKSGEAIIQFADKAGFALGLTEHVTEDTAARLGILFGNIGIGKTEAAAMTLNLEKLAASIAAIRGKDPADILGTLPLALSGSLRGLRSLGFAFTPVQIKNEALQLGLIKTTKQALDPGSRAIAIYALATKDLGGFQAEAAKHSGDAFNVQKRLSAEWDHAKELLGAGLLPELAKAGNEFSVWIDKQTKSGQLQHDFNTVIDDGKTVIKEAAGAIRTIKDGYQAFAGIVGGDHNAAKILSEGFALLYARSKLVKWGIIQAGIKGTGDKAVIAEGEVAGLAGSLSKLKALGPIAIAIALDFIPKAKPSADPNAPSQNPVAKAFTKVPFAGGLFSQANRLADAIDKRLGLIGKKSLLPDAKQIFDQIAKENAFLKDGLKKGLDPLTAAQEAALEKAKAVAAAMAAQRRAGLAAAQEATSQLAAAKQTVADARAALQQAIIDSKTAIAASIQSAKQNLNTLGSQLAGDVAAQLDKQGADGGVLPPILKKRLAELQARIKSGQADTKTVQLAQELQNQIATRANLAGAGTSQKDALTRRFADLSDLFNKGTIGVGRFDKGVDQILKKAGVNAAVIQRTQGVAVADQFRADIAGLKAQAIAERTGPRAAGTGLEATIVKPLDTLREQTKLIAAAQHQVATAQLDESKKHTALLQKIQAAQPSKHDTTQLTALLRAQENGPGQTAADARRATRGRHGN